MDNIAALALSVITDRRSCFSCITEILSRQRAWTFMISGRLWACSLRMKLAKRGHRASSRRQYHGYYKYQHINIIYTSKEARSAVCLLTAIFSSTLYENLHPICVETNLRHFELIKKGKCTQQNITILFFEKPINEEWTSVENFPYKIQNQ